MKNKDAALLKTMMAHLGIRHCPLCYVSEKRHTGSHPFIKLKTSRISVFNMPDKTVHEFIKRDLSHLAFVLQECKQFSVDEIHLFPIALLVKRVMVIEVLVKWIVKNRCTGIHFKKFKLLPVDLWNVVNNHDYFSAYVCEYGSKLIEADRTNDDKRLNNYAFCLLDYRIAGVDYSFVKVLSLVSKLHRRLVEL